MRQQHILIGLLFGFIAYNNANAHGEELAPLGRDLRGFEPSYFMYAFDDDDHIEFKLSIKYPLFKQFHFPADLGKILPGHNQIYFAYTGKYDFFIFSDDDSSRNSAPVISRIQNPGIFISHRPSNSKGDFLKKVSVGWFHESNGQQIDDVATFNNTDNASDFVSRGWDYLGIDLKFQQQAPLFFDGIVNYYLRTRIFCNCQGFGLIDEKEDDVRITFGGNQREKISDYDGLRFILNNIANKRLRYGASMRTGHADTDALKNLSFEFQLTYNLPKIDISLKLFYFKGFGKDISTYHIRDEYFGIGFEMW